MNEILVARWARSIASSSSRVKSLSGGGESSAHSSGLSNEAAFARTHSAKRGASISLKAGIVAISTAKIRRRTDINKIREYE